MKQLSIIIITALMYGCASISPESVQLSATLGNDLQSLHKSHKALVTIYYAKIKDQINEFVDDIYMPYLLSEALKIEMEDFKNGDESLPGLINSAAKGDNDVAAKEVLYYMQDFIQFATEDIQAMRNELLNPINTQEKELLLKVDNAYLNAIYANATLTAHLKSIRRVKETQSEALELIGLENVHETITNYALKASEIVKNATITARKVDKSSDEVLQKIEELKQKLNNL